MLTWAAACRAPTTSPPPPPSGNRVRSACRSTHARRLHYDFRLELDGVLVSWAVPKGPSLDAAEKRFAVEVEDHPVEYADFEGVIPEGNYGAGAVIVWDRGVWIPTTDPVAGLRDGKLLFELRGYKLRGPAGTWSAPSARPRRIPPEWLLMKKADGWARPPRVRARRGLDLLRAHAGGDRRGPAARAPRPPASLEEAGAPKRAVPVDDVKLMLAETRDDAVHRRRLGLRAEARRLPPAGRARGRAAASRLPPRRRRRRTSSPRSRARCGAAVRGPGARRRGGGARRARPSELPGPAEARAAHAQDRPRPRRARAAGDALRLRPAGVRGLRPAPAAARHAQAGAADAHAVRRARCATPTTSSASGEAFYERGREARPRGHRRQARRRAVRRRTLGPLAEAQARTRRGDFVVVGFTRPQGARSGFGALHLGAYDGRAAASTSGASAAASATSSSRTRGKQRSTRSRGSRAPATGPLPQGPRARLGRARARLRGPLQGVDRGGSAAAAGVPALPRGQGPARVPATRTCAGGQPPGPPLGSRRARRPSPRDRAACTSRTSTRSSGPRRSTRRATSSSSTAIVSPWLLPYLRDRPLVLTRYPDGIDGKSFYQKDAPELRARLDPQVPRVERARRRATSSTSSATTWRRSSTSRTWARSRCTSGRAASTTLQHPDWCILDLDPKGAPFAHVVELALLIQRLCDEVGLPALRQDERRVRPARADPARARRAPTSSRGRSRSCWRARSTRERGDIATIERAIRGRGRARSTSTTCRTGTASCWSRRSACARCRGRRCRRRSSGARSTRSLDPKDFTIRTVPPRLAAQERDPLLPVLDRSRTCWRRSRSSRSA